MSWIIGYAGTSLSRDTRERLAAFGGDPMVMSAENTCYVAAGGIEETCLHGTLPDDAGRWLVVGTGVRVDAEECRLLAAEDWRRRLASERPRLDRLGGGFLALRWTTRQVEAFSDVFGLRSLYWMRSGDGFYFSTRPDWLASLGGGRRIDWAAFGSHWLSYHQMSPGSLLEGIERLGPGGTVRLRAGEAWSTAAPYEPSRSEETVDAILGSLLRPAGSRTVSLGLSGGIDSRLLLAAAPERLAVHVFGQATKADVQVALRIAQESARSYSHFHTGPATTDSLVEIIRTHAVQAQAVSPASAAASLRYYPELRAQEKVVVDGGFGEILRRQFMNRLLRRGARALEGRDAASLLPLVAFPRASVFKKEYTREMAFGARRDLAVQLDAVSDLRGLGPEDRVDLLNARTRLPNFFGYEQARLDELVQNYMPFAHTRVVDAVFAIPAAARRDGRTARRLIRRHAPELKKYPLVKGGQTYPFALPSIAASGLMAVKKRLGGREEPDERAHALGRLRDFVFDRIASQSVRQFGAYDLDALDRLAARYYADGVGGAELDWWLAFDFWREAVGAT